MEIVNPLVESFLRNILPERNGIFAEMERYAKEHSVPIVKPEVGQLLKFLVTLHQSTRILEIGTAIGYSTLWLASGINPIEKSELKLVTIEKELTRFEEAQKNLQGLDFIELINGDALEVLKKLPEGFDLIFIDAAKGQYLNFLDLCLPLLNSRGLIVSDNVLFRGLVASAEVDKRYKTLVNKIKAYLETVIHHPSFETTVLPIGDGVAISYKRG